MLNGKNGVYSAKVRLSLIAAGRVLPLSQIGPDFCISREPIELAPQFAEIVTEIDGDRHVHSVYLTNGMSPASSTTPIRDAAKSAVTDG
jgi:hypothetical protein